MTSRAFRNLILASACVAPLAALAQPYPNTSFFGVDVDRNAAWYQRCMAVEHVAAPAADTAPASSKQACDASAMYYDTRAKDAPNTGDWSRVRACAVKSHNEMVLMMLYANGYGVARNADLATRYACSLDQVALAEMQARVEHLARPGQQAKPFDFCDDITSGVSGAVCASMQEEQRARARIAKLDRYGAALPAAAKIAFERLRKAQAAFAAASEEKENDMSGTAAVGLEIEARGKMDAEFLHDLEALDAGTMPRFSAAEYAGLDAKLNLTYHDVINTPSKQDDSPERIGDSTVTRAGVRDTERAWLKFRDAWAAFLTARAAPLDPVSMQALLTERRTRQLAAIPF